MIRFLSIAVDRSQLTGILKFLRFQVVLDGVDLGFLY